MCHLGNDSRGLSQVVLGNLSSISPAVPGTIFALSGASLGFSVLLRRVGCIWAGQSKASAEVYFDHRLLLFHHAPQPCLLSLELVCGQEFLPKPLLTKLCSSASRMKPWRGRSCSGLLEASCWLVSAGSLLTSSSETETPVLSRVTEVVWH